MNKVQISVDFDGVIHRYSKGWYNGTIYDPPIEGAAQALSLLRDAGYYIIIFSTRNFNRTNKKGEVESSQATEIANYLNKYKIPFDSIWTKCAKPPVKLFVDDRSYRFEGNWQQAVLDIQRLVPIKH